jgi:hypothetical protein
MPLATSVPREGGCLYTGENDLQGAPWRPDATSLGVPTCVGRQTLLLMSYCALIDTHLTSLMLITKYTQEKDFYWVCFDEKMSVY